MTGTGILLDTAGSHHTLTSEKKKYKKLIQGIQTEVLDEFHRVWAEAGRWAVG